MKLKLKLENQFKYYDFKPLNNIKFQNYLLLKLGLEKLIHKKIV